MSGSEANIGCISEVTLAINKAKGPHQVNNVRRLDSPDSTCSGNSNSFTVQRFDYNDHETQNGNSEFQESSNTENLRIPIVGYEVMEERARFTVYQLRVELNGDYWFVFRRYTDFVRLCTQLRRQKASMSHLSLPRKKWLGDNFAPTFLKERMRGLQTFVNGLLSSSDLVSLECVREFFCLNEPPSFSDTVEESRAIFESLEDTIYDLRQQLRERENALTAEINICNELRKKLHNFLSETQTCTSCGANNNFTHVEV